MLDDEMKRQIDEFKKTMQEKSKQVHTQLGKAVMKACNEVQTTAMVGMTNTRTDSAKAYKRGRKVHYASADGEYPAVDYGALRRSITHSVEYTETGVQGKVGTMLPYGKYLEFGTSKMAARPWLMPSMDKNKEKIKEILSEAVKDGLHA